MGVKGEVQKSKIPTTTGNGNRDAEPMRGLEGRETDVESEGRVVRSTGEGSWVEVTIDVPGQRDDDNMVVFLGQMIHEGLVADGGLEARLFISKSWHWRLFIDVRFPGSHCSTFFSVVTLA